VLGGCKNITGTYSSNSYAIMVFFVYMYRLLSMK